MTPIPSSLPPIPGPLPTPGVFRREYETLYLNGREHPPAGPDRITVTDPATEQEIGSCPAGTRADIDLAVSAARRAFDQGPWSRMPLTERAALLRSLTVLYQLRVQAMAELITDQNGSPASFTAQTDHPLAILDYYLTDGVELLQTRSRRGRSGTRYLIDREPVGTVAVITPWNMPQKTILMKAAPALLSGCTVIIKPAPETPLDALALAELTHLAGFPPGVINVVPAQRETSAYLASHPGLDKIAFTGSTATGRFITHAAALHDHRLTRVSLELGGKSPLIITPDADLPAAVTALTRDAYTLSGQICSAHTRVLIPAHLSAEFCDLLHAAVRSLPVGDPRDPATVIGPLITSRQRERAESYVTDALLNGACALTPNGTYAKSDVDTLTREYNRPKRPGWYLYPTVLTHLSRNDPATREEIFAPVVCVLEYTGQSEAVALANDTEYGLEAGVFCSDPLRALEIARRLRVGTVRINGAVSDVDAPLGGFKQSGIGRELGPEGLGEYVEPRVIITE